MFRNNGLLHHNVITAAGLLFKAQCWQTTSVHPRVLRFVSWLSSCALTQHSVTHTKNFSSRPAASSTRPANAGTRNPRGLTRPARDSVDALSLSLGTVCRPSPLFSFSSLQHHVHTRRRIDCDKQKSVVVVFTSIITRVAKIVKRASTRKYLKRLR